MKKEHILINRPQLSGVFAPDTVMAMFPEIKLTMARFPKSAALEWARVESIDRISEWAENDDAYNYVIMSSHGHDVSKQREKLLVDIEIRVVERRLEFKNKYGKELFSEKIVPSKEITQLFNDYRNTVREIAIITECLGGYHTVRIFGPADWTMDTVEETMRKRTEGTCKCPHCNTRFRIN